MYEKLVNLFGSKMKADEIIYLVHNQKEVVRQGFYEHEFKKIADFCKVNNLFFAKSKFKVLFNDDEHFTNKGIIIKEDDKREGIYFYYFSKDEAKAYLASFYELTGQEGALGYLLGYPQCCIEFFISSFSEENSNPEHESAEPLINLKKRSEDAVLIAHFPCSPDCEKSKIIARNNLQLLEKVAQSRATELKSSLF